MSPSTVTVTFRLSREERAALRAAARAAGEDLTQYVRTAAFARAGVRSPGKRPVGRPARGRAAG